MLFLKPPGLLLRNLIQNNIKTQAEMIELFIELTDQLFWEGYVEQLAKENPALFQSEFKDFKQL